MSALAKIPKRIRVLAPLSWALAAAIDHTVHRPSSIAYPPSKIEHTTIQPSDIRWPTLSTAFVGLADGNNNGHTKGAGRQDEAKQLYMQVQECTHMKGQKRIEALTATRVGL
uniref:HDC16199 n=1 Tax=Drosophila melanogaster TaxID=7227 RepID=Q6IJ10_DROME|nr:TPA_inf: HDC16199 [Drosophila melanogaster]